MAMYKQPGRYATWQVGPYEWAVWLMAPHTGDRRELIATCSSRKAAQRFIRELEAKDAKSEPPARS